MLSGWTKKKEKTTPTGVCIWLHFRVCDKKKKKEKSATGLWELILNPRTEVEESDQSWAPSPLRGGTRGGSPCIVPSPLNPISGLNCPVREGGSVVSDSLGPHGPWPSRLLCPWDSPGQNTGVGSRPLLQGTFPSQGWTPGLLRWGGFFSVWATREVPKLSNKPGFWSPFFKWGVSLSPLISTAP